MVVIGILWVLSSAILSTWTNTTFIHTFNDPILHTFVRFAGSTIFGLVAMVLSQQVRSIKDITQIGMECMIPTSL
jgi:hypothetical protein